MALLTIWYPFFSITLMFTLNYIQIIHFACTLNVNYILCVPPLGWFFICFIFDCASETGKRIYIYPRAVYTNIYIFIFHDSTFLEKCHVSEGTLYIACRSQSIRFHWERFIIGYRTHRCFYYNYMTFIKTVLLSSIQCLYRHTDMQ